MQDRSYTNRGARAGELALPEIVDAGFIARLMAVLRPTSKPVRCFWCARPLEQGVCRVCDR